jgi:hypothetical protein
MPANDFLPFGVAGGANVIAQASYSGLPARFNGFAAGIANSNELNKVWRQGSIAAALLGQFTMHQSLEDSPDNGDIDDYERRFIKALKAVVESMSMRRAATGGTSTHATIAFTGRAFTTYNTSVLFLADVTSTLSAGADLNVDGLGALPLARVDGSAIQDGDMVSGETALILYNAGKLFVLNLNAYAIQSGSANYAQDTGGPNSIVITLNPVPLGYRAGMPLWVKVNADNTGPVTVTMNSRPARQLTRPDGIQLRKGAIKQGGMIQIVDDGTKFQLLSGRRSFGTLAVIAHTENPGVQGGVIPSVDTWFVRKMNSILSDPGGIVKSLVNSQFTLGPGTYDFDIRPYLYGTARCGTRLYNVTTGQVVAEGDAGNPLSATTSGGLITRDASVILRQVELTTDTTFRVENIANEGTARDYSQGRYTGWASQEIYAQVFIKEVF